MKNREEAAGLVVSPGNDGDEPLLFHPGAAKSGAIYFSTRLGKRAPESSRTLLRRQRRSPTSTSAAALPCARRAPRDEMRPRLICPAAPR
ncbi:hypothetical protein AAFF_G00146960 [Aldrovandia affinis]|uniref:Uncharacterized protein n=1 Tax=Aldrovandia affinis TaxID=143900 RepID=A0AAD7W956_9TELE|nr:hypothetical protein AAFF_G00146960 [Aldrovandia affinis]